MLLAAKEGLQSTGQTDKHVGNRRAKANKAMLQRNKRRGNLSRMVAASSTGRTRYPKKQQSHRFRCVDMLATPTHTRTHTQAPKIHTPDKQLS